MGDSEIDPGRKENIDTAIAEYEYCYKRLKFVKSIEGKCELVKGVSMLAKDIALAKGSIKYPQFTFTVTAYDFTNQVWDRCPGCGDPSINHDSDGHKWQGCFTCHVLLRENGIIQSMDPTKKRRGKSEPFGHKVDEKDDKAEAEISR